MAPLFQRLFAGEDEEERSKTVPTPSEEATTDNTVAKADSEQRSGDETMSIDNTVRESPAGLIPASNLPPAAHALEELFAETPALETPREEHTSRPEENVEQAAEEQVEPPVVEAAPKRRNLFARLLGFKHRPKAAQEKTVDAEQNSSAEVQGGTAVEGLAESKGAAVVVAEPDIESDAVGADLTARANTQESLIPSEFLPSAAQDLENLFPSEQGSVEANVEMSVEQHDEVQDEVPEIAIEEACENVSVGSVGSVDQANEDEIVDEIVEVTRPTFSKSNFGSSFANRAMVQEPSPNASANSSGENAGPNGHDVDIDALTAEIGQEVDRLGSGETEASYEVAAVSNAQAASDEQLPEKPAETPEANLSTKELEDELESQSPRIPLAPRRLYKDWAFDEKLASHREWAESHGQAGQRADLSGAELEASDLISVNLRLADLHDANLRASDLLLADLRDACLVRADLEEACLVGANLEGANLEGASLETAMGLVPRQFAGANLRDALLAPHLMEFEAVAAFERESHNAFRYFWAMTAVSVLSWLVIWRTRDAQLITDSAVIPFLRSHAAATALPTAESYLIVPVALFIVYLLFHFHLQRLWDSVMELPAIFPDGHTLGDCGPEIISGLLRTHFRWMNPDPSSTRLVEKGVSLLAAYWIVPITLFLFWSRYLTRQEIHGTMLHALLVMIATGIAMYATTKVGRPQERWAFEKQQAQHLIAKLKAVNPISMAATVGAVLLLLSVGTIAGVPHDRTRAPQYGAANIRRWAPSLFGWLAYDPYADLTEASISRRPANWNGADDQVAAVDGLRANNARFRYAQAYGVFLANSHLWRADFQGAFLSEADLRSADLGQSNMKFAVMDHTQMNHANLDRSNLDGADMRRADLREANLSYCSLVDAILVDARLDGASFYTAKLPGANLTRAILQRADLRESYLAGAHMDHADLRSAYLWSAKLPGADLGGAQLGSAILIDADLHGANLGGAQLNGTVLNGADLTGTSLEGADLRGALGLSANQVCSAKSRRGVTLDPDMETQVEAQCGKL